MDARELFERLREAEAKRTEADRRATAAEAKATAEYTRRLQVEAGANDHPNTSWGALYAERDKWRAAWNELAERVSLDGVSLLEWRRRARAAEKALQDIRQMIEALLPPRTG